MMVTVELTLTLVQIMLFAGPRAVKGHFAHATFVMVQDDAAMPDAGPWWPNNPGANPKVACAMRCFVQGSMCNGFQMSGPDDVKCQILEQNPIGNTLSLHASPGVTVYGRTAAEGQPLPAIPIESPPTATSQSISTTELPMNSMTPDTPTMMTTSSDPMSTTVSSATVTTSTASNNPTNSMTSNTEPTTTTTEPTTTTTETTTTSTVKTTPVVTSPNCTFSNCSYGWTCVNVTGQPQCMACVSYNVTRATAITLCQIGPPGANLMVYDDSANSWKKNSVAALLKLRPECKSSVYWTANRTEPKVSKSKREAHWSQNASPASGNRVPTALRRTPDNATSTGMRAKRDSGSSGSGSNQNCSVFSAQDDATFGQIKYIPCSQLTGYLCDVIPP